MKTGPKPKDHTGIVYSGITALHFVEMRGTRRIWRVRCFCGNEFNTGIHAVIGGRTRSCGCILKHFLSSGNAHRSHGLRRSPEYNVWCLMRRRCNDPLNRSYHRYGGRGISVCKRWLSDFGYFYEDMGPRPTPQHSIERKNNDGNYEPGNCRWATASEQAANRKEYRNGKAKFTDEQVASIRTGVANGTPTKHLARIYDVSCSAINYAATGRSYAHISNPPPVPMKRGPYTKRICPS